VTIPWRRNSLDFKGAHRLDGSPLRRVLTAVIVQISPILTLGAEPLFRVHTNLPGLEYRNISGSKAQLPIVEQNGQGVCLLDFDNDGWMDIFVTNGGTLEAWRRGEHPGCRLYRNLDDLRFVDVTSQAGVGGQAWSNGCTAADYDDDGDMDLYVTNWGSNVLYRNNGDGTFTDLTAEGGVGGSGWSSSAVFADFDGDGKLDLYVSHYVHFDPDAVPETEAGGGPCLYRGVVTGCGPWRYEGQRDALYLQTARGEFTEVSEDWGLAATAGHRGMGLGAGDFDADGNVDIYVAVDVGPNIYLKNEDRRRFVSIGQLRGGALNAEGMHESGMGVAAADLFDRGWLDVLTTNFAGEKTTYYRNQGGYLEDRSREIGSDRHRPELGWGITVADFDQDGRRDVFVANGQIYPQVNGLGDPEDRYELSPRVYLGTARERLVELPPARAFGWPACDSVRRPAGSADREQTIAFSLRAIASGDLDNDGDIDIVAVQHNGPLVVFENQSNQQAAVITLRTRNGGLSPHGAHIRIGAWHHYHWPGHGYQCSHDPRIFITGFADDFARVDWPDGTTSTHPVPQAGQCAIWPAGK